MSENYDVQQVCESGHQITDCYINRPEQRNKFCQECGASTIIDCPTCDEKIQGARIEVRQSFLDARSGRSRNISVIPADVPRYCQNCGAPFPWTQRKITAVIQNLVEFGDLNEEEKKTIEQDVENIAKDVPEAELSARRIKRIWERGKSVGYEVIMEFASRTAAKILKEH